MNKLFFFFNPRKETAMKFCVLWNGKGKAWFPYFSVAPCAIKEVLYGFDDEPVTNKVRNNLKCNPDDPLNASRNMMVTKITPNTKRINVKVVYADDTESESVSFDIPK